MVNLQPLYEVQERLEHAAVAGTGILQEDFRLKRAWEGLAPLAGASPVFAKISAGLEALLEAPPEKRGGALLDVLALVDAVVYTQASTGEAGELEPLPPGVGTYQEVSYSQLRPLLEALTGTGGGRAAAVADIWKEHPEYFSDYRVLPALVKGLGDNYTDLADQNQKRLVRLGSVAVPLLKEGFDPQGGREMARRVAVLDEVAGASENDFYRAQLPGAKKEVRAALIGALRHDPSNIPLLLELSQTERKGDNRDRVWQTMAQMEGPEVECALLSLAEKDWGEAVDALASSDAPLACRLTAQLFAAELEPFEQQPDRPVPEEMKLRLSALTAALDWKTGPEVCRLYRRAAAVAATFTHLTTKNGKQVEVRFSHTFAGQEGTTFQALMPMVLTHTLMGRPDPELCRLALELYGQYGTDYLPPALTAQLLTQDSPGSYQWAEKQVVKSGLLKASIRDEAVRPLQIALGQLNWVETEQKYLYSRPRPTLDHQITWVYVPVPTLDPRWFTRMAQAKGRLDEVLVRLLFSREAIPALSDQVRSYLYQMAMTRSQYNRALEAITILKRQNWTDWTDFALKWVQKWGQNCYHWEILHLLDEMPIPPLAKVEQLCQISALVWDKKLKIRGGRWPSAEIQEKYSEWEQQAKMEGGTGHV